MEAAGFATEWHAFDDRTPIGNKRFRNLIAVHNMSAPRWLTLACHYDSKYFPKYVQGSTLTYKKRLRFDKV